MATQTRPYVGVAVILVRNKRVLLGMRRGSHGNGCWAFPGGHLEFGESFESCATREVAEETGLTITTTRILTITNDILEADNRHYVTIFMVAECMDGEAVVCEPETCEAWRWFEWHALPEPLFLPVVNLLKAGYTPFT